MSDRPDWLPVPVPSRSQALGLRMLISTVRIVLLLLCLVAAAFVVAAVACAFQIAGSQRHHELALRVTFFYGYAAAITLGIAAVLYGCLRRFQRDFP